MRMIIPRIWDPSDLTTGPDAWLTAARPDTFTTSGTDVTGWADISGNGNDASEASLYPELGGTTLNGFDLPYSNKDSRMIMTGFGQTQPHTIIVVSKRTATGNKQRHCYGTGNAGNIGYNRNSIITAWSGESISDGLVHTTETNIVSCVYNGSSSKLRTGGKQRAFGNVGTSNPSLMHLFSNSSGGESFAGGIAEILFFNYGLSDSEMESVEGYLVWMWGITTILDSDHPYKRIMPNV